MFTWLDLLSKVGGLISIVNLVFAALATFFNLEAILVSMVEQTFYHGPDNVAKKISYSFMDHIRRPFSKFIGLFKKPSCHQRSLNSAVDRIKGDLDIIQIIQTLRKLQAGVATLLASDEKKIVRAKELYFKHLYVDHKGHHKCEE